MAKLNNQQPWNMTVYPGWTGKKGKNNEEKEKEPEDKMGQRVVIPLKIGSHSKLGAVAGHFSLVRSPSYPQFCNRSARWVFILVEATFKESKGLEDMVQVHPRSRILL